MSRGQLVDWETDHGIVDRHLASFGNRRMRLVGLVVAPKADEGEALEHERDALGGEVRRCVHDLKVQMRRRCLAGVSEQGDRISALHVVAGVHAYAAAFEVPVHDVP